MTRCSAWGRRIERLAAAAAVAVIFCAGARALASFRDVPRHELVLSSDDVVLVRVEASRNVFGEIPHFEGPAPFTEALARVERVFRGGALEGERIAFRVEGGLKPDGGFLMVSTSPALEDYAGGKALVFLARDAYGPGLHGLAHRALGLYRVERDRAGRDVVRGVTGHPIARDIAVDAMPDVVREALERR